MAPREIDLALRGAVRDAEDIEDVRQLLGQKADPNASTVGGRSLLSLAVEREQPALCRLLLVYQASPEMDSPRSSPRGDVEPAPSEAAELVSGWARGDPAVVLPTLELLVGEAAGCHDAALLGLALATADVVGGDGERLAARCDDQGRSLLHICASFAGRASEAAARTTARALLGWGVPVDCRTSAEETPLLLAIRKMCAAGRAGAVPEEPARALLEARADAEAVDPRTQERLLMQAAREGCVAACRLLLDHGADPLRSGPDGRTPIRLAADRPEVLLLLRTALVLNVGAEPMARSSGSRASLADTDELPGQRWSASSLEATNGEGSQAKTPMTQFSLHEVDQELCSAEGLLNQVDLEEDYDVDWNTPLVAG